MYIENNRSFSSTSAAHVYMIMYCCKALVPLEMIDYNSYKQWVMLLFIYYTVRRSDDDDGCCSSDDDCNNTDIDCNEGFDDSVHDSLCDVVKFEYNGYLDDYDNILYIHIL